MSPPKAHDHRIELPPFCGEMAKPPLCSAGIQGARCRLAGAFLLAFAYLPIGVNGGLDTVNLSRVS